MATNPDVQRAMLHMATILSTAYEFDSGTQPTPQGPMFVAFQQLGYDLHYFNNLILVGVKMSYWTATNETITLTELGIEKAKFLKEMTAKEKN
jgi:hypothetical protein